MIYWMRGVFAVCLGLAVLLLVLVVMVVEKEPLALPSHNTDLNNAESVNGLLKEARSINRRRFYQQTILLQDEQLNSLMGLLQRALPEFAGHVDMLDGQTRMRASYQLPRQLGHRYVNMQMTIASGDGLQVGQIHLGQLTLSGNSLIGLVTWLADWWTNSNIASELLRQVKHIAIGHDHMLVTLHPIDPFLRQLNKVKNGINVEQDDALRIATAHYLEFLWRLPIDKEDRNLSLRHYLAPLFEEVGLRSAGNDIAEQNQAALLALAIYTGHHRLANLVGDVQPIDQGVVLPRYKPTLAGRVDLTRHFVISAALQILSHRGISLAIGEFKELMDRGNGGSGYSFVDLAADMAGVQLGAAAASPRFAQRIQQLLQNADSEAMFFPDITGLPEGLNKQAFTEVYGDVDSAEYRAQIKEIEARLGATDMLKTIAFKGDS